jgi:hypothetical protein
VRHVAQRGVAGGEQFVQLAWRHVGVGQAIRPTVAVLVEHVFQRHVGDQRKIVYAGQNPRIVVV